MIFFCDYLLIFFFFSLFGGPSKNRIWEYIFIFEVLVNSGSFGHQLQFPNPHALPGITTITLLGLFFNIFLCMCIYRQILTKKYSIRFNF